MRGVSGIERYHAPPPNANIWVVIWS
jgi:hypothetical protein